MTGDFAQSNSFTCVSGAPLLSLEGTRSENYSIAKVDTR
jgi:hypothetical protein